MKKEMVTKGLSLPQSHRDAISNGLKRYWSMNEMSQERRDNISKGQKKHLAERDASQIQAHKEAISKGTREYYKIHDGPWKGVPHTMKTRQKISKTMKEYWKSRKREKER